MTPLEICLCVILAVVFVLAILNTGAAYRNGVTDGYGYCREKHNPGYRHAGDYLRKYMAHRWHELKEYNGPP